MSVWLVNSYINKPVTLLKVLSAKRINTLEKIDKVSVKIRLKIKLKLNLTLKAAGFFKYV